MRLFQSIFSFKTQFLLYLKEESESVRMKQVSAFYEAENRVKIQKRIFKSYTARGAILWFFKKVENPKLLLLNNRTFWNSHLVKNIVDVK